MPGSLQGVLAILLAILPGALAVWGFERISGRRAIGLSARRKSRATSRSSADLMPLAWRSALVSGEFRVTGSTALRRAPLGRRSRGTLNAQ